MTINTYTSSITGNTKKLMDHIINHLNKDHKMQSFDTRQWIKDQSILQDQSIFQADLHIVGFWCRRGSMDDDSLELLEHMKGENIILIGTLGNYPDSAYGDRVRKRVAAIVEKKNTLWGLYICQGKIEESRTDRRRKLPKDHRHYLDDRGYQRHLDSRSHPDEEDLSKALIYVDNIIKE